MPQPQISAKRHLADRFELSGWHVEPSDGGVDLVISQGPLRYAIEFKVAREARKDRLIPLLAQAVLQARSHARAADAQPLAVIVAPPLSPRVIEQIDAFAEQHAPDVAFGIVDLEGFAHFRGSGLQSLQIPPASLRRVRAPIASPVARQLFSDLNQWMLKVLLAPRIPGRLLNAPRGEYRNVSELARAARVSVMTAFRFQQQLVAGGFLDEGAPSLHLVRLPELFRQWQASYIQLPHDLPMQWLLDRPLLPDALRRYESRREGESPRACLGLFAAAEALDIGFVHGVPPHVYIERVVARSLQQLGLRPAGRGQQPDVFIRVARPRESLLRGAVEREGVLAADVLQVWLDVSNYPARGAEQAEEIRRSVLSHLLT